MYADSVHRISKGAGSEIIETLPLISATDDISKDAHRTFFIIPCTTSISYADSVQEHSETLWGHITQCQQRLKGVTKATVDHFILQSSSFQSECKRCRSHSRDRSLPIDLSRSNGSSASSRKEAVTTTSPSIKPPRREVQNGSEDDTRSISKYAVTMPAASPATAFVTGPPKPKDNKKLSGFNSVTRFSETRRSGRIADKEAKMTRTFID